MNNRAYQVGIVVHIVGHKKAPPGEGEALMIVGRLMVTASARLPSNQSPETLDCSYEGKDLPSHSTVIPR